MIHLEYVIHMISLFCIIIYILNILDQIVRLQIDGWLFRETT